MIDGRFFQQNASSFDATVSANAPYAVDAGMPTILRGADMTVVAKTATAYGPATGATDMLGTTTARIDGLGLTTGHGDGAGGIQLQANINNMQLTNNVLENNGGVVVGGIGVGQPGAYNAGNKKVRIANDRLIGNGALTQAGGLGIFYGSDNYDVAGSIMCSNFSVNYGAGIAAIGLSPGGKIHDNQVYYNDSVDSGAGIAIESELLPGSPGSATIGSGTGAVDIDRNLIQANFSGDDGGGIYLLDALLQPVNIRNNMIVDNGAAVMGGGMTIVNSGKVSIVNNTIADNVSTGSGEGSLVGVPHAAGLATEGNDPDFQAMIPSGPDFSNPVALFNNIFWNNNAFTLDQFGPGATLVNQGFIDFEIAGTTNNADTFTPRFSDLTNGQILGPNGVQHALPGGQGNTIGANPNFVTPFTLELGISGSRLDAQQAAVTITGTDPPVGLTGDYHIALPTGLGARLIAALVSPIIDRGARCSNTPSGPPGPGPNNNACVSGGIEAPNVDYDGQSRPQIMTLRLNTRWDRGADESTLLP